MVMPFQMQSILPDVSSSSFASQSIGVNTAVTPRRRATSVARSMSKPGDLVLIVAKAHGRVAVVKTDDQRAFVKHRVERCIACGGGVFFHQVCAAQQASTPNHFSEMLLAVPSSSISSMQPCTARPSAISPRLR